MEIQVQWNLQRVVSNDRFWKSNWNRWTQKQGIPVTMHFEIRLQHKFSPVLFPVPENCADFTSVDGVLGCSHFRNLSVRFSDYYFNNFQFRFEISITH